MFLTQQARNLFQQSVKIYNYNSTLLQFNGSCMSLCTIDLILESTVERCLRRSGMHKNPSMLCPTAIVIGESERA